MYLCIFWLLLLSIYKIFFLLNCVIYACWGIPWQNFLESPLAAGHPLSASLSLKPYGLVQSHGYVFSFFLFWVHFAPLPLSLSLSFSFSLSSPSPSHPHPHSLIDPLSPSFSSCGGCCLSRQSTGLLDRREMWSCC